MPRLQTPRRAGFTLIELIVVMAVVALLASIAAPRYQRSLQLAREQTLRANLQVLRDALDQFAADRGRYPDQLEDLASQRYVRQLPEDPITGRVDQWIALPASADDRIQGPVADVRSGAAGRGSDGRLYAEW